MKKDHLKRLLLKKNIIKIKVNVRFVSEKELKGKRIKKKRKKENFNNF